MDRVFCKDCKYHFDPFFPYDSGMHHCKHSSSMKVIFDGFSHSKICINDCYAKNKDNNCTDYKRKWWKV